MPVGVGGIHPGIQSPPGACIVSMSEMFNPVIVNREAIDRWPGITTSSFWTSHRLHIYQLDVN